MKEVVSVAIEIREELCISDAALRQELWEMYDETFTEVNTATPCRQHCYKEEFLEAMQDSDFQKFLLCVDEKPVGIGLITNHLEKVPWINVAFFKKQFPVLMSVNLVYYLMGIAVKSGLATRSLGSRLLKEMICSLPENGAVAFDYSGGANRAIPMFAERALPKSIKGTILDSQIYSMYRWGDSSGQ
ncbi:hypothetical protein KJ591_01105 [Patescibacteria group bacterium]|nr:hypothetical protein [Patescibacteria group bacterium]